jgi:hypothetical protein
MINRRPQPLVVSGTWDFIGVLLATSGFLLFLGPVLLSDTFSQMLNEPSIQRSSRSIADVIATAWASWWVLWILYYLIILGGGGYLLWLRSHATVIYNIERRTLETVLAGVVERLGLPASQLGNRLFIGVSDAPVPLTAAPTPVAAASHVTAGPAPLADASHHVMSHPTPTGEAGQPLQQLAAGGGAATPRLQIISEQVIIDVEALEMLNNVSLHWYRASPAARATLERELRQALAEVHVPENAVSTWLLGIATLLFLVVMMMTAVFVIAAIWMRRGP